MLVSTHNLGSVPEFCDRTILVKGTVLAHGPTETTFTRENLEHAFGGVLRHFTLGGQALHADGDTREVTILTDDERPFVQYGEKTQTTAKPARKPTDPAGMMRHPAGAVLLWLYDQCHVGIGAGRRRLRLSVGLPDAQGLVADW